MATRDNAIFTVNIPTGGNVNVKYQIETISNGNHGYFMSLQDTDSLEYIIQNAIAPSSGSITGTFIVLNSQVNLKFSINARPTINSEELNEVECTFTLFKCDGLTLIPSASFTLYDDDFETNVIL